MEGLLDTLNTKEGEDVFSFENYFVPLTNTKAITWIIVIGIFIYANMLFNGFVWDDVTYFVNNIDFQSLNFYQLFGPNIFNITNQYRPIPAIYFFTLHSIFGQSTFFYHVIQLLIHITHSCYAIT